MAETTVTLAAEEAAEEATLAMTGDAPVAAADDDGDVLETDNSKSSLRTLHGGEIFTQRQEKEDGDMTDGDVGGALSSLSAPLLRWTFKSFPNNADAFDN